MHTSHSFSIQSLLLVGKSLHEHYSWAFHRNLWNQLIPLLWGVNRYIAQSPREKLSNCDHFPESVIIIGCVHKTAATALTLVSFHNPSFKNTSPVCTNVYLYDDLHLTLQIQNHQDYWEIITFGCIALCVKEYLSFLSWRQGQKTKKPTFSFWTSCSGTIQRYLLLFLTGYCTHAINTLICGLIGQMPRWPPSLLKEFSLSLSLPSGKKNHSLRLMLPYLAFLQSLLESNQGSAFS